MPARSPTICVARFEAGEFDVAHLLLFDASKPRSVQVPSNSRSSTASPVLVRPAEQQTTDADGDTATVLVEYEPSEEAILEDLLPRNVAMQIFKGRLENARSRNRARR